MRRSRLDESDGRAMAPRHKTLRDLVRDVTFPARRHSHLLVDDPLVGDPALRTLQKQYRDEASKLERRAIALRFEKAVRIRDPLERVHSLLADDELAVVDVDELVQKASRRLSTAEFWYCSMGPGFGDWTGWDALGFRQPDGTIDWDGFQRLERRWKWWDAR
jgi:hypothetical protein